ncbi:cyclin domain-containing protein [Aphelenchoides avenae]|nr:cyclin domain-containing protein [Aphelenchus avenae]
MVHSFKQYPFPVTALGCLFLAGKVEETPKKCKDICAKAAEHNPSVFSSKTLVEEVFAIEKQMLQTLRFDLHVEHPYTFLLQYAKPLKLDKQQKALLVQTAWTFINDSQSTTLCLLWEPEIVAIALMYLSIKMNSMENLIDWEGRTSRDEQWWDMYVANLTTTMMEEICHKVLDYYQQVNSQNSSQAAF